MLIVWIALALIVLFFAWASWKTRGRGSSGPESTGDRHKKTGGYSQGN